MDDAAGEAYDKVARTLGLPLPRRPQRGRGGARDGNPKAYKLPVPHVDGKYNVSFSGLKTAVINEVHNARAEGPGRERGRHGRELSKRIDQIRPKAAGRGGGHKRRAGRAGRRRRRQWPSAPAGQRRAQKLGAKIFLPELKYCGDNGAMIAAQGYYEFQDGNLADWSPERPADAAD